MADEEWRATNLPGYEASSWGRVRSVDRSISCRDGRTRRFRGQLIKPHKGLDDYWRVMLHVHDVGYHRTVHPLVCEAFHGPRPPGQEVRHKNGDQDDNAASNLLWGTRSQNHRDKREHGTDHQLNKVRCPRFHPLEPPNLVPGALPHRDCLACNRARSYIRYHPELSDQLKAISDKYYERIIQS